AAPPPPQSAQSLIQLALKQRPDLMALLYREQSAQKLGRAQREQMLPTISALGTAGTVPVRPAAYYSNNWWGAVGVNMSIPIFDGFFYNAQAKASSLRAEAASEHARALRMLRGRLRPQRGRL